MNEEIRDLQPTAEHLPVEADELSMTELVARRRKVLEVIARVMKPEIHYGVIPGCKKPSLYQPGAEVLYSTFMLRPELHVEPIESAKEIRYRIMADVIHFPSGRTVGHGLGECSSMEEKYAWRAAVCDEEWDATDPEDRRIKFSKVWSGPQGNRAFSIEQVKQVRTNPKDVANTILKMAAKRCRVDGSKSTVGCSDVFGQDVEDLVEAGLETIVQDEGESDFPATAEENPKGDGGAKPSAETTTPTTAASIPDDVFEEIRQLWHTKGAISDKQRNRLYAIATGAGWKADDVSAIVRAKLGVDPGSVPWGHPYETLVAAFEKHHPAKEGAAA